VAEAGTRLALVVDPGDEVERLRRRIDELELQVVLVLCTHGHVDHAGGAADLVTALGVPLAMHPGDERWLQALPQRARIWGMPTRRVPEVDRPVAHGDTLAIGGLTARVLHTPGHTPAGCCLHFEAQGVVFTGDTLFAGSVGRTDLPTGSAATLVQSIHTHLLALDDEVVVYPGHGPPTTIGAERRDNPFLRPGG